ncbi:MAG: metallophosphoesterase, partial [Bacteroidaceae bacterium]|nr:metallophosphoesterase [Bacteroidaceae bacterium]
MSAPLPDWLKTDYLTMNRLCYILFFLVGGALASAQDADIKILAINDMHSAVQHMPKLAFIVDSIRAIHPDALLFSGGDNRTGNPINDMYTEPNLPMVEMMNAMGFNFSTMGNHECD